MLLIQEEQMNKMDRRSFIRKLSLTGGSIMALPVIGNISTFLTSSCTKNTSYKLIDATDNSFPLLEVSGSYYDIGYEIGKTFSSNINLVFERRDKWFGKLKDYVIKDRHNIYKKLLTEAESHFPHLVDELKGLSKGCGISFEDIFTLNIKAELQSLIDKSEQNNPGCSTIYCIDDKEKFLLHNEDGNTAFSDIMFLVKVTPPSKTTFIALTYPGIFIGNGPGINDHGIVQTTNYIASRKMNIGVPRYFLNRAVLEAKSLKEALRIVTYPQRAFAYHHNLASFDEKKILSVEVTPDNHSVIEGRNLFYHTNHMIHKKTKSLPQNQKYVKTSSLSRFEVIKREVNKMSDRKDINKSDCLKILSSHANKPYSPCRHPEGKVKGQTLATAVIDINKRCMYIYKGNPCVSTMENKYKVYNF